MRKQGKLLSEQSLGEISGSKRSMQYNEDLTFDSSDIFQPVDTTIVREGVIGQSTKLPHFAGSLAQSFILSDQMMMADDVSSSKNRLFVLCS